MDTALSPVLALKSAAEPDSRRQPPRSAPQTAWPPCGPPPWATEGGQTAWERPETRWQSGCPTRAQRPGQEGGGTCRSRSLVADRHHFVAANPAGSLHFGGIALFLADQGAGDRARDIDEPLLQIRLVLAHDLVFHEVARLFVFQFDRGAKDALAAAIHGAGVDHLRHRQLALDLLDAAFDEALAVLGGVIVSVFAEVALRARFGNCRDHSGALYGLEAVQFFLELFSTALGNRNGGHRVASP